MRDLSVDGRTHDSQCRRTAASDLNPSAASGPGAVQIPTLGITVHPMEADALVRLVCRPAEKPSFILNHNAHSTYLAQKHTHFRNFYDLAHVTVIDGWPILVMASIHAKRWLGTRFRIGSTDWIARLSQVPPERALRIYLLGGSAELNEAAQSKLASHVPGACVDGAHGYFEIEGTGREIVDRIREFAPDLVIVGMGMPRQEEFLATWVDHLPPAHYATVGGAIHYVGGGTSLAPRWLGAIGLEWLWRFAHEPRRLCRRYFVEPFELIYLLVTRRRSPD